MRWFPDPSLQKKPFHCDFENFFVFRAEMFWTNTFFGLRFFLAKYSNISWKKFERSDKGKYFLPKK